MSTWSEITGIVGEWDGKADPDAAVRHLKWAFEPEDIVHLVAMRDKNLGKTSVISVGGKRDEVCESVMYGGLEGLGAKPWNVYYQITPAKTVIEGKGVRQGIEDSVEPFMLFADLDVGKDGAFGSREAVQRFIDSVSLSPASIVWTGSGGAHVSWKLARGTLEGRTEGIRIGSYWWSWLESELKRIGGFDGVKIDRLIDNESRVLRLPGTIRWAKHDGDIVAPVTAEYRDVPDIEFDEFMDVVSEPYEQYTTKMDEVRRKNREIVQETFEISGRGDSWNDMMVMAFVDEWVSETVTWDEILSGAGWTKLREGGDGSVEWTRPGGHGKSATVDWPESPEIMSLFSYAEETGLADLYEAGVDLTKWRVFLRLVWDDNVWEALNDVGERVKKR